MQNLSESYSRLQVEIPLLRAYYHYWSYQISEKIYNSCNGKNYADKISQKYPENKENTLHEIDFTIKRGEVVAIAEEWKRKSTLSVYIGLVSPEEGRILIDNKPLLSAEYVHGKVSVVK